MMNLLFSGRCPEKHIQDIGGAIGGSIVKRRIYKECSIKLPEMEFCFHFIKTLVEEGWELNKVKILDQNERLLIDLSKDVLGGEPILQHIETIKRELDNRLCVGKLGKFGIIIKRIIWG